MKNKISAPNIPHLKQSKSVTRAAVLAMLLSTGSAGAADLKPASIKSANLKPAPTVPTLSSETSSHSFNAYSLGNEKDLKLKEMLNGMNFRIYVDELITFGRHALGLHADVKTLGLDIPQPELQKEAIGLVRYQFKF